MKDFTNKGLWLSIFVVVLCQFNTYSQTSSKNYVMSRTIRVSGIKTDAQLNTASLDKSQVSTTIQYLDGLGRPIQTVQRQGSPLGNDMIQTQAYDSYGRETTKYLPYTASGGTAAYRTDAATAQSSFYSSPSAGIPTDNYPYATTLIEASPLNRTIEQGAQGNAWQPYTPSISNSGHTVKMDYLFNNNDVRQAALYTASINNDGSRTLNRASNSATYNPGQLHVSVAKDENWISGQLGTTETYTDKSGHVLLKRTFNSVNGSTNAISTYYVYDDKGDLAFVLSPGANPDATNAILQTTLNNFCYQYQYDERGRTVAKKIPGKGWEYMVYNILDQPVASQDSNQRVNNQWAFVKYDGNGRAVITGIWDNGNTAISRVSLQSTLSAMSSNLWETPITTGNGYTANAWPTSWTITMTINYYDDYSLIPNLPSGYSPPSGYSIMTRGMLLASKTAIVNTPTDMLWSVIYYDNLGRNVKSYKQHYLGGTASLSANNYDAVTTQYNFTNQPTTVTRKHYVANNLSVTIINGYTYDHMGRVLDDSVQINNGTHIIQSRQVYNELGQSYQKKLHSEDNGSNFIETVTNTFHQRGWLSETSSANFDEKLYYETPSGTISGATGEFNGNITEAWYNSPSVANKGFSYTYDNINRLTHSQYYSGSTYNGNLDETIQYDQMSNITQLIRGSYGSPGYTYSGTFDYTSYTGNQVNTINNNGSLYKSFSYDGNGNTLSAGNYSYTFNVLNQLNQVKLSGSAFNSYTYDAGGNKLRKVSTVSGNTTTTDYISGIQYKNGAIDFIGTDEGRYEYSAGVYDYGLKDHLGNVRVIIKKNTSTTAVPVQETEYYAFGLAITRYDNSTNNKYLYGGKELQDENALNQYDFMARFYDPVIARWTAIDPLAEKSRRWSTYNYASNNPVGRIDPDGMEDIDSYGRATHDNNGMYIPSGERGEKDYDYQREQEQANRQQNDEQQTSLGTQSTTNPGEIASVEASGDDSNVDSQVGNIRLVSSSVTKFRMDAKISVDNIEASGLQIIQIAYLPSRGGFGPSVMIGDKAYIGQVDQDRGKAFGTPYYFDKEDILRFSHWYGNMGDISAVDLPTVQQGFSSVRFESVIVAVNFNHSGSDKILGSFTWGYDNGSPITNKVTLSSMPSQNTLNSIKLTYPYYKIK